MGGQGRKGFMYLWSYLGLNKHGVQCNLSTYVQDRPPRKLRQVTLLGEAMMKIMLREVMADERETSAMNGLAPMVVFVSRRTTTHLGPGQRMTARHCPAD